jgi:hypothetical protein
MITVAMAVIFIIPILTGILKPMTSGRVHRSFVSLLNTVIFLASVILAIYLTGLILTSENIILAGLYRLFPSLQNAVTNGESWVYAVFVIALLLAADGILHLLAFPLYRYALTPASERVASAVGSMNGFMRRLVGGLWKLPQAICLVLVFCILLSFCTGFFNSSVITRYAETSAPYQLVQKTVIEPISDSSAVKDIQVIVNNSFKAAENELNNVAGKHLTKYFNGVTLDEAVKSSPEIDAEAKEIVGAETDDRQKAYLIYLWICVNITYDNNKAAQVVSDPDSVSSGAVVAYTTRTGICFDFACLYVAMCRAADVKVRFITGLGFSGSEWGDHAWNQAYDSKEDVWLNVDTTFGSSGLNYFDRPYFYADHKDGVVQSEW